MQEDYLNIDKPIIKIDIQDVIDFCYCPYYYKLKNKDMQINIQELYDLAIHKVIYRYLRMLMDDKLNSSSIETLKYLWGQEWIKEKTNSKIIVHTSAQWRGTYDTYRQMGIKAIESFNSLINNVEQTPIIVNKEWEVHIASNVYLTGKWEYIREIDSDNGPLIQIMHFLTQTNRSATNAMFQKDLLATASLYAFNNTFNDIAVQLAYVDMYSEKFKPTLRTERDFELLKRSTISTALCLMNGIECISLDRKCYFCEYRDKCVSTIGGKNNGDFMELIRKKVETQHDGNEYKFRRQNDNQ